MDRIADIANRVREEGKVLLSSVRAGTSVELSLPSAINTFLRPSFIAGPGSIVDLGGRKSEHFAALVYLSSQAQLGGSEIPADAVACVIDVSQKLDLEGLRKSYSRVAHAKSLKKTPTPVGKSNLQTNVTLGIIFAVESELPMEALAQEIDNLNRNTPSTHWPDMMVVLSKGTFHYAVQFPGEGVSGDYLPPAEGALANFTPPVYIIPVVRPTQEFTFNKMVAFLLAHLQLFVPGVVLPKWIEILQGSPREVLTLKGYQYNLAGELVAVPKEFYNDRYLPPPPVLLHSPQGELLGTLQFLPWQDGGVVLATGKLPLDGLLVFLGKEALKKGGFLRLKDRQISYVLPISAANFAEMLNRIQRQSNLVLRKEESKFIFQKLADEGSTSPFMARMGIGVAYLRDYALRDAQKKRDFDRSFEFVFMTLINIRKTAQEIVQLISEHSSKAARGEILRRSEGVLYIEENIDKELRRQTESFLNSAVRVLKQGVQEVANCLGVKTGFLFKKLTTFESGLAALRTSDPYLADYLQRVREWSERLVECRNALEHSASVLPKVQYLPGIAGARVKEPELSGQPLSRFVDFMTDRLCSFAEDLIAHCLAQLLPDSMAITEVPLLERDPERPERFRLILKMGGSGVWVIKYHDNPFEST
jgi:hypothetical protein